MLLKNKKITGILNSAPSQGVQFANTDFSESNLVRLKSILSFFSYLNMKGEISDESLEALVRYACSIFIENEVEARVQDAIEQRLIIFLQSKFSSVLDKYVS
ncbi:hypothetical protein NIES4074_48310 [Cylindrospermum sp. NIES-4074]|nr:hypothetical protein NIES4074_48310 [Cylindrospermum sp. NIES-4074]